MVKELSDKHLAAINRGRKAAGLKPIRRKKKTSKYPAELFKTTRAGQKAAKEIAEYKEGLHRAGTRKFSGMTERKLKKNGGKNA